MVGGTKYKTKQDFVNAARATLMFIFSLVLMVSGGFFAFMNRSVGFTIIFFGMLLFWHSWKKISKVEYG